MCERRRISQGVVTLISSTRGHSCVYCISINVKRLTHLYIYTHTIEGRRMYLQSAPKIRVCVRSVRNKAREYII